MLPPIIAILMMPFSSSGNLGFVQLTCFFVDFPESSGEGVEVMLSFPFRQGSCSGCHHEELRSEALAWRVDEIDRLLISLPYFQVVVDGQTVLDCC